MSCIEEVLARGCIEEVPSVADFIISALQTGFISGVVCQDTDFEKSVVPLFAHARTSVLQGVNFVFKPLECGWYIRMSRSVACGQVRNTCNCDACRELRYDAWPDEKCYHREFIRTLLTMGPGLFARQLVLDSFPYTLQFDSKVSAVVYQQRPEYQIREELSEQRSLLAPPESLSGL